MRSMADRMRHDARRPLAKSCSIGVKPGICIYILFTCFGCICLYNACHAHAVRVLMREPAAGGPGYLTEVRCRAERHRSHDHAVDTADDARANAPAPREWPG